jgi:hypothetical protein
LTSLIQAADDVKPPRLAFCLGAVLLFLCGALLAPAQGVTIVSTLPQAIAAANAEGKLILAEFGTPDSSACRQVDELLTRNRHLQGTLTSSFVLWTNNIDKSSDLAAYMSFVPDASLTGDLPLLCVIDPGGTNEMFRAYLGRQLSGPLGLDLEDQAIRHLPLVIRNLPSTPLKQRSLTLSGTASPNARSVGAVTNAAIKSILYRLNGSEKPWLTANGTKKWKAALTLEPGTNTLEMCVLYASDQRSRTNRVPLVCQP